MYPPPPIPSAFPLILYSHCPLPPPFLILPAYPSFFYLLTLSPISQTTPSLPSHRRHPPSHLTDDTLSPISQTTPLSPISQKIPSFPSHRRHPLSHLIDDTPLSHLTEDTLSPISQTTPSLPSHRRHPLSHLTDDTLSPISQTTPSLPSHRRHTPSPGVGIRVGSHLHIGEICLNLREWLGKHILIAAEEYLLQKEFSRTLAVEVL